MAHRNLAVGELLLDGDEGYYDGLGTWLPTKRAGQRVLIGQTYRRNEETSEPGTPPQTTVTTEKPMTLIKVWITQKPSALEQQAGEVEKLILPPVEVLADDKQQAVMLVTFTNAEKLAAANLPRCTVQAINV